MVVFGIYNCLRKIRFLQNLHQWYWSKKTSLRENIQLMIVRRNYRRVFPRIRAIFGVRKLKVLFVIGDNSKWKCQRVYERMFASKLFDPFVAITVVDLNFIDPLFQKARIRECIDFFERKGVRTLVAVDSDTLGTRPLVDFCPDIVIYQQPWGIAWNQDPVAVSQYALTFYVPYYIPAVGDAWAQVTSFFHRSLFGNFLENKQWVSFFKQLLSKKNGMPYLLPCGCPQREEISRVLDEGLNRDVVIYAPHWSFPQVGLKNSDIYSTFLDTGRVMLEFAKAHSEVSWVFKPHPILRERLIQSRVWSVEEVKSYYAAWARIGVVCQDGDYVRLFARSKGLITDSLSFLSEYLIVNRPLIRLEQNEEPKPFLPPAQGKLEGMYRVRTIDELKQVLDRVIVRGDDYLRDVRTAVVRKFGYDKNDISNQMIDRLTEILSDKE